MNTVDARVGAQCRNTVWLRLAGVWQRRLMAHGARIFNLVGQVFRMLSKIKWRWICLISSLALCCWIVRVCGLTSGFIVCLVVNMVLALVYVVQAMSQWWPQCHFYWRCECLPRVSDSGNLVVQPMHCRTVSIGGWLHHCSGGEKHILHNIFYFVESQSQQ